MATARLLIDTSIFIEFLRRQNKARSVLYHIADTYVLYTSTVVEFELYAGAIDDRKRQDIEVILARCTVLPFTSDAAQTAAQIYQQLKATNQLIEMRDILIAATAIVADLPVMTLNHLHFHRISTLRIIPAPHF